MLFVNQRFEAAEAHSISAEPDPTKGVEGERGGGWG